MHVVVIMEFPDWVQVKKIYYSYVLEQVSDMTLSENNWIISVTTMNNVCNSVEDHCLRAMKIVHNHANGRFDWLTSGQQTINPSREVISILSGKYKRFTFVHPV